MYVTLKMPASAAHKLNLTVDHRGEAVTVKLTPIELAGRLTVVAGRLITPEGVAKYCGAWAAARAACRGLVDKYGTVGLIDMLRAGCVECLLWLPEDDRDVVAWLRLVLEGHLLQSEYGSKVTPLEAYAWAYQQRAKRLMGLCEAMFPVAYRWWLGTEMAGLSIQERAPLHVGDNARENHC